MENLAGEMLLLGVGGVVHRGVQIRLIFSVSAILVAAPAFGEAAAGSLIGAAAITSAAMPAVVSGIQAGADVAIAGIQADAQAYMNDSTNAASRDLGYMSMQTQLAIAGMGRDVALNANNQVTYRLGMQLGALERAGIQNTQFSLLQMRNEYALRFASLALQNRLLDYQFSQGMLGAGQNAHPMSNSGESIPVRSYGMAAESATVATPPAQRLLASLNQPIFTTPRAVTRAPQGIGLHARGMARSASKTPANFAGWRRHIPNPSPIYGGAESLGLGSHHHSH